MPRRRHLGRAHTPEGASRKTNPLRGTIGRWNARGHVYRKGIVLRARLITRGAARSIATDAVGKTQIARRQSWVMKV